MPLTERGWVAWNSDLEPTCLPPVFWGSNVDRYTHWSKRHQWWVDEHLRPLHSNDRPIRKELKVRKPSQNLTPLKVHFGEGVFSLKAIIKDHLEGIKALIPLFPYRGKLAKEDANKLPTKVNTSHMEREMGILANSCLRTALQDLPQWICGGSCQYYQKHAFSVISGVHSCWQRRR